MRNLLLSLALLVGCAEADGKSQTTQPPVIPLWRTATPQNRIVYAPEWLRPYPTLLTEAFAEIDSQGLPKATQYTIQDPGLYSFRDYKTGDHIVVYGHTDMKDIWVAWTGDLGAAPRLPALAHEVGHVRTQNPCAGHAAGCTP